MIKGDPELPVRLFVFLDADRNEPLPELYVVRIVMLQLCEFGSCKVVQRRILLRFPVETDIERHKRVNPAGFHFLLIAPFAIGNNELSELRAPVPQMVYPHAFIAQKGIYLIQRIA